MSDAPARVIPNAMDLEPLKIAFASVDGYQPVYKFEGQFKGKLASRHCADRCDFLARELAPDVKNLRILDVGCSMGYLSLYFAERGAHVTGIDHSAANIEFCSILSNMTGIKSTFEHAEFSEDYCKSIEDGRFDVVFLFSVLHHVTLKYGISTVRRIMRQLLEKSDVLYVELAQKSEDVPFTWKDALPENDLEIFDGVPDLEIIRLGEFPALGDTVIRPFYRVRKKSKLFNNIMHQSLSIKRSDIKDGRTIDRKYAITNEIFSKIFVVDNRDLYLRFCAELDVARRLSGRAGFLPVLGSELRGRLAIITWPRIFGRSLLDALLRNEDLNSREIAIAVLGILRSFSNVGLYWNDLRSHNVMLTDRGIFAIDFEVAAPVEIENTLNIFLWMLYDLQSKVPMTQAHRIFDGGPLNVPPPPLTADEYAEPIRDLASLALTSLDIRDLISKASQI